MTQDEILKMAREVRLGTTSTHNGKLGHFINDANFLEEIERFARLIAQAERDACAKLCEELGKNDDSFYAEFSRSEDCAFAIRTRGNT